MASIQTPIGNAPIIPIVLLGIGLYLSWFAVHYWGSDTAWPSDPVKNILQGKGLTPATGQVNATLVAQTIEGTGPSQSQANPGSPSPGGKNEGPVSGNYNHAQLMTLWTSNGGSPATANIAGAIAMAESSGRPDATSSNPDGGINVGLWQLDTKGKGAGYTVAQLQDPGTNARVAVFGSSNGTNWSAWATFASGTYKAFLS